MASKRTQTMPQSPSSSSSDVDYVPPSKKVKFDGDNVSEYNELKEILLKNTGMDCFELFTFIGVPDTLIQQCRLDHPGYQWFFASVFNVWFPAAKQIGSERGVTPRQILAHGYRTSRRTDVFQKMIQDESTRTFIKTKDNVFNSITDSIYEMLQ